MMRRNSKANSLVLTVFYRQLGGLKELEYLLFHVSLMVSTKFADRAWALHRNGLVVERCVKYLDSAPSAIRRERFGVTPSSVRSESKDLNSRIEITIFRLLVFKSPRNLDRSYKIFRSMALLERVIVPDVPGLRASPSQTC
jgi:hypothetical protein